MTPRAMWVPAALAAVALLLALAAGTSVAVQWSAGADRSAAQGAARSQAEALFSIDPDRSVDGARAVLDASTGEFADLYRRNADAYLATVKDGQVRMTVDGVHTGIDAVDGDTARALSAVRVTVHNLDVPDGEKRSYRLTQELRKEDGRWLVSRVDFGT